MFKNHISFCFFLLIDNLAKADPNLSTEERVANAMKHAGISITVTSLSGIAAFLIGSTTVINEFIVFIFYLMNALVYST